jgi:hypothetical protein
MFDYTYHIIYLLPMYAIPIHCLLKALSLHTIDICLCIRLLGMVTKNIPKNTYFDRLGAMLRSTFLAIFFSNFWRKQLAFLLPTHVTVIFPA